MGQSANIQNELDQRHRKASLVMFLVLAFVLILCGLGFWAGERFSRPGAPGVVMGLWIAILVFGLGALILRRTRFAATRLKDIVAVRGLSAMLKTLQNTAIQLALLSAAIAAMGFVILIRTGDWFNMLRAGGVAVVVLLYGYPIKSSWQRAVTILGADLD